MTLSFIFNYYWIAKLKSILIYPYIFKKYGKGSIIRKPLFITPSTIFIGNNVFIWKNCRIEGVKNYEGVSYDPSIEIQDNVTIQQNLHLTCANKIVIGKHSAIAANVSITDIHHPYVDITIPIEKQQLDVGAVYIGENCKIYNNVVILPNTIIGRHCTIGANSVVSGVIPDFSVCAGVPSKIIKKYNTKIQKWEKPTDFK